MRAGRLKHRITIERLVNTQDKETGAISQTWRRFKTVYAEIVPLSVREYLAASQLQSKVSARITIRYIPGITASMRIRYGRKIYNIEGVLADRDTGHTYLTLPVSEGVDNG